MESCRGDAKQAVAFRNDASEKETAEIKMNQFSDFHRSYNIFVFALGTTETYQVLRSIRILCTAAKRQAEVFTLQITCSFAMLHNG